MRGKLSGSRQRLNGNVKSGRKLIVKCMFKEQEADMSSLDGCGAVIPNRY